MKQTLYFSPFPQTSRDLIYRTAVFCGILCFIHPLLIRAPHGLRARGDLDVILIVFFLQSEIWHKIVLKNSKIQILKVAVNENFYFHSIKLLKSSHSQTSWVPKENMSLVLKVSFEQYVIFTNLFLRWGLTQPWCDLGSFVSCDLLVLDWPGKDFKDESEWE